VIKTAIISVDQFLLYLGCAQAIHIRFINKVVMWELILLY